MPLYPPWSIVSGQFLRAPSSYAPASLATLSTTSATLAALTGVATTVAIGSNGGEISTVASWGGTYGGNGVLDVASSALFPAAGGTFTVSTSSTTATCTYTGTAAGQLTGVAYVSGSATGTVSTGGAVTLTSPVASTGSFTAPASGSVVVTVSGVYTGTSTDNVSFALAAHGTVTPVVGYVVTGLLGSTADITGAIQFLVTGLSGSNNFDLLYAIASAGTLSFKAIGQTSTTPTGTLGAPIVMTVQAV